MWWIGDPVNKVTLRKCDSRQKIGSLLKARSQREPWEWVDQEQESTGAVETGALDPCLWGSRHA
jgi:hypothetical protein